MPAMIISTQIVSHARLPPIRAASHCSPVAMGP